MNDGSINILYSTPSGVELILDVEYNWILTMLNIPSNKDPFSQFEDPGGDIEVVGMDIDTFEMNYHRFTPEQIRLANRFFKLWKDQIFKDLNSDKWRNMIISEIAA